MEFSPLIKKNVRCPLFDIREEALWGKIISCFDSWWTFTPSWNKNKSYIIEGEKDFKALIMGKEKKSLPLQRQLAHTL